MDGLLRLNYPSGIRSNWSKCFDKNKSNCSLLWLIQKVKRHRKSKHVETQPWIPVQPLNHKIRRILFFFFFFKESISVPHISVCKSPKMIDQNDALVQGWSYQVQSTCRGSCNTRMECWWLSTSSTSGSSWYSTSLLAPCTQQGKTRCFCSPLPSCCTPLVLTDTSQKTQKPPLLTAASSPQPATCQQGSRQSVCPFFHQHCVCVSSFCVGVFYSALPLFKSTVATGQSMGISKSKGFHGV